MSDSPRNGVRPLTMALWVLAILGVCLPLGIAAWSRVARDMGQCRLVGDWKSRGDAAFAAGDYSVAVRAYGRARALAPERRDVTAALSRAHVQELAWFPEGLRQADLDEVRLDVAQVEQAFPSDRPTAMAMRGFIAAASGRIPEGEKLYRDALAIDKDNGPAHLGLALLLRRQDSKLADAIAEMKEVVKARPKAPELQAMLGRMQSDQGDYASALASLKAAVDLRQEATTLRDLGQAALATQDTKLAIESLQNATRMDGGRDPTTLSLLAQAFLSANKPDMAEAAARASLAIQENQPTAFRLAMALNMQRKFAESLPILQRMAAGGRDLLVFQELGTALAGVGRLKDAVDVFTSVVSAPLPSDQNQAAVFKQVQAAAAKGIEQIRAQAAAGAPAAGARK
jgi:tetratricopeptide (TPR) repeat protein